MTDSPESEASTDLQAPPATWLSTLVAGLCVLVAALSVMWSLQPWRAWDPPWSLPVRVGGLAGALLLATGAGWLSRRLRAGPGRLFFRLCLALVGGVFLLPLLGAMVRAYGYTPPEGGWSVPYAAGLQAAGTGLVYLMLWIARL
jgi:hypothetical protein